MRWLVLVLVAGGCNQIFDLRETHAVDPIDAEHPYFDAPIDAPFACPPIGSAPVFAQLIHQAIAQNCHNYSYAQSQDLAAAICNSTSSPSEIQTGPINAALTKVPEIMQPTSGMYFNTARISPEGDRLYVIATDNVAQTVRLLRYARTGTTWSAMPDLAIAVAWNEFPQIIGITPAPHAHLLMRQNYKLREYVSDDAGAWTALPAYLDTDLGVVVYSGSTTSDGLHVLLQGPLVPSTGQLGFTYTDRPDLASRFRLATSVPSVPGQINDPFLDDSCARVYFSGFGSIFYIQQL